MADFLPTNAKPLTGNVATNLAKPGRPKNKLTAPTMDKITSANEIAKGINFLLAADCSLMATAARTLFLLNLLPYEARRPNLSLLSVIFFISAKDSMLLPVGFFPVDKGMDSLVNCFSKKSCTLYRRTSISWPNSSLKNP